MRAEGRRLNTLISKRAALERLWNLMGKWPTTWQHNGHDKHKYKHKHKKKQQANAKHKHEQERKLKLRKTLKLCNRLNARARDVLPCERNTFGSHN